jgi:hypothetical protein
MTAVGWIGIWLLAVGLAAIVVGLALAAPSVLRVRRKAVILTALLEREEIARSLEVERLRLALRHLESRLRPYRRARRLLLHPLTVALVESYRRRGIRK